MTYWNLLLSIFSVCLAFERNLTDFKPLHLRNYLFINICYQLFMLLLGRISPGAIISHHLKIPSLGIVEDLTVWMFIIWESFFSNHKSESLIPQYIFILYIFQKFCYFKKLQNSPGTSPESGGIEKTLMRPHDLVSWTIVNTKKTLVDIVKW